MSEVTKIIQALDQGDAVAADQLLPLVYHELRSLAEAKLSKENNPQSIQPTMLVHEAYLRLVDVPEPQNWNGRGHFFGAAAEAMRRILIERARHRASAKQGGDLVRQPLNSDTPVVESQAQEMLDLNEALKKFEEDWPDKSNVVKLKYFVGLTIPEISDALGISTATVERHWRFARAWLRSTLEEGEN